MSSPFLQAYKKLNPDQKLAVDTIDGPVMVIAGPGTGKTQILATRIANILLKTDTPPEAILALTFTDSGAIAMRERLLGLAGGGEEEVSGESVGRSWEDEVNANPPAEDASDEVVPEDSAAEDDGA